jgi:hypothetical protein
VTTVPPSKYDPEITASLVTKARLLIATPDGAFSAPDMRAVDLAIRLVAPGPKACAVSASECHEITEAIIAAYDRGTFPIKAHETITALVDQLEAAGGAARDASKWYDEVHELRSRLKRSDTALAAAGAPMHELLTDEGAEWVRCELDAVALQLNAAQADSTLSLSAQVKTLHDARDALRKDRLLVAARRGELETELRSMTSLCAKAQHDRDLFRSQAEERGRELRDAMSGAAQLTASHRRTVDELRALHDEALVNAVTAARREAEAVELLDEALAKAATAARREAEAVELAKSCRQQDGRNKRTIARLALRIKQLEAAGKPNPKKPQRAKLRKKT